MPRLSTRFPSASRFCLTLFVCLAGLGLITTTIGCGGGSGSTPPIPAPTLTAVAPASGTSLGGTALTLTGTNFLAGATVTVGGASATGVMVVDDMTITCVAPAGTPGATVDVAVTTAGGTATAAASFLYFALPTVTAVTPPEGLTLGGTDIMITGTGFVANAAGANSVTVGGVAATAIVTVDDTTITCTTPAGLVGPADVAVSNANGTGTLLGGFTYVAPMVWAADGKGGVAGNLYTVDVATGATTIVGPIGFAVSGLAYSPAGDLYATEAATGGTSQLLRIDATTGAGSIVGTLSDGMTSYTVAGLTFVGTRLIGWSETGDDAVEIDPMTAAVTVLGPGVSSYGSGFAADAAGTAYLAVGQQLHTVDTSTGAATPTVAITNATGGVQNAMVFHQGTLYGCDSNYGGSACALMSIDPATGTGTQIGALPNGIDALATNAR